MGVAYTVRTIDRLLRFNTTDGDITVTLQPFAQTPNAPYEMHRVSTGDGNTVLIQTDPSTSDFLLPDGSKSIVLDDTNFWALIKIPQNGESPAFVTMGGAAGGGGGGVPGQAPPVSIGTPPAPIPRETDLVEVDVPYTVNPAATPQTYSGCTVYIEDPDMSSGAQAPLDGSTSLDGSAQVSGQWNPLRDQDTHKSPVAVLIPEGVVDRTVRIYLAAFGPNSTAQLVRANDTTQTPTPSVVVTIPAVSSTYVSGMEVAWLVTNVGVKVNTEYNLAPPLYTLTFSYLPPTPEQEAHRPPGLSAFGGVAIWYKYFDDGRLVQAMQHPYVATAATVGQVQSWKSTEYQASKGSFRVYFVSTDVGGDQNSIVDGITPWVDVTIDPTPAAPKVTHLQIVPGSAGVIYLLDGSFIEEATFSWTLPTDGLVRYAGVALYRVATTGTTPVPAPIFSQTGATDTQATVEIQNVPTPAETWTIAAISVDFNGQLEDDPNTWGSQSWTSPVAYWTVGPPGFGVTGGGIEYAPLVTNQAGVPGVNAGATVVAAESTSSDGVRTVTFAINGTNGAWTNPTDNKFGGAWVALVVNSDVSHAIYWKVPKGDNHFTTPAIPAPGSFGQVIPLAFYILSNDPQEHRNSLQVTVTPVILLSTYAPSEGVIIPSRNPLTPQWFSSEFSWVNNAMTVDSIGAGKIQVGSLLQVGGQNSFATTAQNGQIGVFDVHNKMVGWIGVAQVSTGQQPQNSVGLNNYGGAWFGQLWVGGDSPAHAPVWIDQNGVVMVGGIAAAAGAPYPYISVRDNYGLEKGRIGAMLTNPPPPGDSGAVSSVPPGVTSGAWFTQFAAGGSSATNWQVLIDGSTTPGKFYIRDTDTFSINFAATGTPYIIDMGKSVFAGVASQNNSVQFPGIRIYEASGSPPQQIFGSILLNRGLVLRGRPEQGYGVIGSLAMVNGDSNGSDVPVYFWGQLAMYNPMSPSIMTVDLSSGFIQSGQVYGDSHLYLYDRNGHYTFTAGQSGDVTFSGALGLRNASTSGYPNGGVMVLIDSAGNWKGGGMAGVTSVIAGTGISISPPAGTGAVTITNSGVTQVVGGRGVAVSGFTGSSTISIGQDVGTGQNVTFQNITANGPVQANTPFTSNGFLISNTLGNPFRVDGYGDIFAASIALAPNGTNDSIHVGGIKCCDYNGVWSGNGLATTTASVGAASLAIWFGGQFVYGAPLANQLTFRTADGKTVTVTGGLITSVA
jgi:hypothetical protein